MKDDPVIARIRAVRHDISARFGHDPRKLVEHYRKEQERHARRLIGLAPTEARELAVSDANGAYETADEPRR